MNKQLHHKKIALITGANRGLGLAVSHKLAQVGYHVILVGRNALQLELVTSSLNEQSYSAEFITADVSKPGDCEKLLADLKKSHEKIDVLVNNAGIYVDESHDATHLTFGEDVLIKTMNTNTYAPFRLMKGILPLMQKNNYGRIVNVSSGLGSQAGIASHCFSYSVSKATLNSITRLFASEIKNPNIKINAVCPGWVRTDMGGPTATRSIDEGVSGIYWAATLPADGPHGGFFRDGQPIAW